MLNHGGIMTRREEIGCFREACPESNKRPDISVFNMPGVPGKLILDVAVTSPVANQSTREISRAQALIKERIAKQRFNAKITKYQAIQYNTIVLIGFLLKDH